MKKQFAFFSTLALVGWCIYRDKKYPLANGYGLFNKVIFNGNMINEKTLKLANKILSHKKLPDVPQKLIRDQIKIKTRDQQEITLSIYKEENKKEKSPCLVYFHGGGFFLKDAPYIHKIVMQYALHAKCTVVFVHYRTSDKYPFPIPFYDCCDSLKYIWENTKELNIDQNKIAIGGDSAGGALAAACSHWCKKQHISLCFQMLIYPVIDQRMNTKSTIEYKDAPLWNSGMSKKMWNIYLRDGMKEKEEYASPILAHDFSGLPPTYIEVSEFDSLYDEGKNYASILKENHVPVELCKIKGGFHGFDVLENTSLTKKAMNKRCQVLYDLFYKKEL